MAEYYSIIYIIFIQIYKCIFIYILCIYIFIVLLYYIHLLYPFSVVEGHLDCFPILAIANNFSVNTGMCVSFQISGVFVFFSSYISRSGPAESYGSPSFSSLRDLRTVLPSASTNLLSNQQYTGFYFTPSLDSSPSCYYFGPKVRQLDVIICLQLLGILT